MSNRPRSNTAGSSRGVRFSEDNSSPGIDYDLMRAAFADQAAVQSQQQPQKQHQQQRQSHQAPPPPTFNASITPPDGETFPFSPGYSLSAPASAENARRAQLAVEVSPLEPSPSSSRGSNQRRAQVQDEDEDYNDDDVQFHLKSPKGRRSTAGNIQNPFGIQDSEDEETDVEDNEPRSLGENAGLGSRAAAAPHKGKAPGQGDSSVSSSSSRSKAPPVPKDEVVLQREQDEIDEEEGGPRSLSENSSLGSRSASAPMKGMGFEAHRSASNKFNQMPSRPEPVAVPGSTHRGYNSGASPFSPQSNQQAFSPRMPTSPFSPQQRQQFSGQFTVPSSPKVPHIQTYDPTSSPSMVVPFSPKVTASGSIMSPSLKPSLVRRDVSVENFKLDDGDSCERGVVRRGEAEDVKKTWGGESGSGMMKSLVGLYRGATSPEDSYSSGNKTAGLGFSAPGLRHQPSDNSLDGATLNEGQSGHTYNKDSQPQPTYPHSFSQQAPFPSKNFDQDQDAPDYKPPIARSYTQRRQSMAFMLGQDEEVMDEYHPAFTGTIRKSMQAKRDRQFQHRRSSWSSETGDPEVPFRQRRKSTSARRASVSSAKPDDDDEDEKYTQPRRKSFDRRKSATTITNHVSHVLSRQKFILKLAKALMTFGAPSHRIESQLNATANVLEVDAQFIHFPGMVIAAFGDIDKHTSETHFVKSSGGLTLGRLHDVHTVYRKVVHDEIGVAEGSEELDMMLKAKPCYNKWQRIILAGLTCFVIAPLSFGGSLIDACIAACYGCGLTFLQLHAAKKNAMYSNVFEISVAIIISFISRALSTTGIFCYQAIASSGVILVLPGYIILCGSLELASKNMIAGSVRMVYAIIYSLFLGFGIAIGSDLYFVLDPHARAEQWVPLDSATEVKGAFTMSNETMPLWEGTFSFSNGTKNKLNTGSINCEREADWPWYRQEISPWFNFLFVPLFSILLCFNNLQPWKSRHLPVMVFIACVGYVANMTANHYVFNRSDVVSAIGSFVIGVLGNAYSRIFRGTAFTAMAVAVLFLVPSGMAMAGGLAMTYKNSDGDLYSNGLTIGFRMVEVAIGITVGLFGSALVVYSFGRRKGAALFAF